MLNPVAVEALYSATFVENYLDCVENLPDDLQRHLTRMRELDVSYRACLRDVHNNLPNSMLPKDESNTTLNNKRTRAISRIQRSLIVAQELGDEKLQVVQLLQDLIDHKSRQLDLDFRNLVSCLDYGNGNNAKEEHMIVDPPANAKDSGGDPVPQQQASTGGNNGTAGGRGGGQGNSSPTHNHDRERDKDRTVERASKRARRTRNDVSNNEINERSTGNGREDAREGRGERDRGQGDRERDRDRGDIHTQSTPASQHSQADPPQRGNTGNSKKNTTGKIGTGKKKKRKSRQTQSNQRDETPPPEDPDPIDPDEPTYCLCDQISFGEMILCDNDLCPIEWFHFSCVSLNTKPKGKWFCPKCRGDRPNVMKPKSQFLKELERYNKEKEEKA